MVFWIFWAGSQQNCHTVQRHAFQLLGVLADLVGCLNWRWDLMVLACRLPVPRQQVDFESSGSSFALLASVWPLPDAAGRLGHGRWFGCYCAHGGWPVAFQDDSKGTKLLRSFPVEQLSLECELQQLSGGRWLEWGWIPRYPFRRASSHNLGTLGMHRWENPIFWADALGLRNGSAGKNGIQQSLRCHFSSVPGWLHHSSACRLECRWKAGSLCLQPSTRQITLFWKPPRAVVGGNP